MVMSNLDPVIEAKFPNLAHEGYELTSPIDPAYNCIAWAATVNNRWWWPDPLRQCYWPSAVPRRCTVEAFILAYGLSGYVVCESDTYEDGYEKIMIYTDQNNLPKHAARQIGAGRWTSKLGPYKDITHTRDGLNGVQYGQPKIFMKRKMASI